MANVAGPAPVLKEGYLYKQEAHDITWLIRRHFGLTATPNGAPQLAYLTLWPEELRVTIAVDRRVTISCQPSLVRNDVWPFSISMPMTNNSRGHTSLYLSGSTLDETMSWMKALVAAGASCSGALDAGVYAQEAGFSTRAANFFCNLNCTVPQRQAPSHGEAPTHPRLSVHKEDESSSKPSLSQAITQAEKVVSMLEEQRQQQLALASGAEDPTYADLYQDEYDDGPTTQQPVPDSSRVLLIFFSILSAWCAPRPRIKPTPSAAHSAHHAARAGDPSADAKALAAAVRLTRTRSW